MFKTILVPTDGSELSKRAARSAVKFAKVLGATIVALHVMPEYSMPGFVEFPTYGQWSMDEFMKATEEEAKRAVQVVADEAKAVGVVCETVQVRHSHAYEAIIDTAKKKDCDLIYMASHGRRGLSALVLGSETHKVLTHSKITVLVYR